jgi:hypothetical protein
MFKKLLMACAIMISGSTMSQSNETFDIEKTISCGDRKAVVTILVREYKEVPVFHGLEEDNEEINYGLFVNVSTGTWTMVQFDKKIMCVIGSGEKASMSDAFKKQSI